MDGGSTVIQLLGQVEIRDGDVFQYRFDLARGLGVAYHSCNGSCSSHRGRCLGIEGVVYMGVA